MQFSYIFIACYSLVIVTRLGFHDWVVFFVVKALQSIIAFSRSRFPLKFLNSPPTALNSVFMFFVCSSVCRSEYAANPGCCYRCNRSGHRAKECRVALPSNSIKSQGQS